MRQAIHHLVQPTRGKALVEITAPVELWVRAQEMGMGVLTLFCRHTSASLLIGENAAPAVQKDLLFFFERLAPEGAFYVHNEEGADDMPAHLRAAVTSTSLSIPLEDGRLLLGRWQGIFLFEHRASPHRREVVLHLFGA